MSIATQNEERAVQAAAGRAPTAARSMHVCFLNPQIEFYSPVSGGAVATITMQHARELERRGYRVTVLSPVNGDPTYGVGTLIPVEGPQRHQLNKFQRAISRVSTRVFKYDAAYYRWYRNSFVKALRKLTPKPDVVVLHNDFISPIYIKRAVPGAKVLVDLQNEQRTCRSDISPLVNSVHKFVACSRHIKKWTSEHHKIASEKFVVVNNGIDLEAFYPRENWREKRAAVKVLFIGRIDPNKGPDIAADAVAQLRAEGLPVELTVAGGLWFYGHGNEMADPYFRDLKGRMEKAQATHVGFVTRDKVPALVREHDVVCVLSRSNDPNPLVCLEGMASGCAVLASDRGGLPDACDGAGVMVDPDDFAAVVGALRRMVVDAEYLRAEKEKSIARASRASWADKSLELEAAFLS